MFLSILVAFYDTVSLHQAGQIFIICIFLSAIIQNVNLAASQVLNKNKNKLLDKDCNKQLSGQVREQEARQGQCQELR